MENKSWHFLRGAPSLKTLKTTVLEQQAHLFRNRGVIPQEYFQGFALASLLSLK